MLFLIGGVPRAGKSTVRRELLERYKISGIDLESIRQIISRVQPEVFEDISDQTILCEKMWPWINSFADEWKTQANEYFVLEGEYFTPENVVQFKDNPGCKVCFLIYPEITVKEKVHAIRQRNSYTSDWMKDASDEELSHTIESMIEQSQRYKKMCQLLDIEYFDTSFDYKDSIEQAVQYLIGR